MPLHMQLESSPKILLGMLPTTSHHSQEPSTSPQDNRETPNLSLALSVLYSQLPTLPELFKLTSTYYLYALNHANRGFVYDSQTHKPLHGPWLKLLSL